MRRSVMIDHVGLLVSDLQRSAAFYEAALRPLAYKLVKKSDDAYHFGLENLGGGDLILYRSNEATSRAHLGFLAPSAEAVRQFFSAGINAGGSQRLKPAIRLEYHDDYYAAFLNDPDGNNVEAVYYGPSHPIHLVSD